MERQWVLSEGHLVEREWVLSEGYLVERVVK